MFCVWIPVFLLSMCVHVYRGQELTLNVFLDHLFLLRHSRSQLWVDWLTDWLLRLPSPKITGMCLHGCWGANPGPHVWEAHYWRNHLPCSGLWSWLDHPLFPYPKRHLFCLDLFLLKIDIPHCADVDMSTVLQPKNVKIIDVTKCGLLKSF